MNQRVTEGFPALDSADFGGSVAELTEFSRQRYARLARAAFAARGRGVLILRADHRTQTLDPIYNTMEGDDGSPKARQVRALVDSYNPANQAVLLFRSQAHGLDAAEIIDIDTEH